MNLLLCDDNADVLVQEEFVIEDAMKHIRNKGSIDTTTSPKECLELIRRETKFYDVIFMDIEMPGISGLELGKKIKEINPKIHVIFVTGFDKYSLLAYEVHPFYYIMKPLAVQQTIQILNEVIGYEKMSVDKNKDICKIVIEVNKHIISILANDIVYIEKNGNISKIVTKTKEYFTYISLKALEEQLNNQKKHFIYQCHQTFMVNMCCVREYEDSEFLLENGMRIPVSRMKRSEAKKEFYHILRKEET